MLHDIKGSGITEIAKLLDRSAKQAKQCFIGQRIH